MNGFNARRPPAAMIVAMVALVAALAGTATALPGKGKVDKNDLAKNVVKAKNIKQGAVTGTKIQPGAVAGEQVADDSLTGADIDEASLGAVGGVAYEQLVDLRLSFGQDVEVAANGPVSIRAACLQNANIDGSPSRDGLVLYGATTAPQAFQAGDNDDFQGDVNGNGAEAGEYLTPATARADAELASADAATGGNPEQEVLNEIDHGFVLSTDGKFVGYDGESTVFALRALGADCAFISAIRTQN